MSVIFKGIIPPVPTLFDEKEQFDETAMQRLIDHLVATDVNGLFFLGSAGEFAHMSDALRQRVMKFCIEAVGGRKPVLVGIAHPGTQATIDFGHLAQEYGADGVVVVNPWYNPLAEDYLFEHFRYIAEQLTLPIIIYNFPALTGQSIPVSCITQLALACPNIVGVKDTVDTLNHIREVIHAVKPLRPEFAVFSGYDEYLLGTLILGGDGAIPASANFAPQLTCGIYRHWLAKQFAEANALQIRLSWIPALYSLDVPFYNVVKYALTLIGLDLPVYSLKPTGPLSEERKARVREALQNSGVI
ncbi:dihydrodipicolinate synthase family protein [Biostraticola tofi]|uniref:4-hydroxy-tetrahydrodipicolinate synthase n=1 Tax=Biostraticola tofi TaxID=466109 RepID=A0A4R3YSM0_9GAMM|nr:dihydrodipicolinate synthase family protein [Biostraticola tofi]TCV94284.1 4-hydroxy-tetrahydrodipicolinate synthase [Biostraticola tofi]